MSHLVTTLSRMDTSPQALTGRISAEVKRAMKERGLSQREMSRRTGIPLNTFNARLQSGTTRPFTVGELALVLDVLNISLVELAIRAERAAAAA